VQIDKATAGGSGGGQFKDEDYQFPTGIYMCRLNEVKEIGPRPDDEKKTPRLVFEFEVADGPYRGKRTTTFVKKNLFPGGGAKNAKPSGLFKLAKSLGVIDPMAGFDTDQFVGKHYQIMCEQNEDGRAWPTSYVPASPPGQAPAGPPPRPGAAPPRPGTPAPPRKFWLIGPGDASEREVTEADIRAAHAAGSLAEGTQVCPVGGSQWVSPAEAIPDLASIPY
jgi:hypothetical protein